MRIEGAQIRTFEAAVPSPIGAANARQWSRAGVLLRLEDDQGHVGLGEASPLPGYSPDTLDACRSALERFAARLPIESPLAGEARVSSEDFAVDSPAARFALETAVWDLVSRRLDVPLWACLRRSFADVASPADAEPVPVSTVLPTEDERQCLEAARAALNHGIGTLKVKVGRRGDFERECDLLARLRAEVGSNVALRLDANQAFEEREARSMLLELSKLVPELIEEPLPATKLNVLAGSPIPIALDESLQRPDTWSMLSGSASAMNLVAVVLKPMTLGGFARCADHARRAAREGLDVTVSHLFDGPVGLAAAQHLALAIASRTRASGLHTHPALAGWKPVFGLPLSGARLIAPDRPGLGVQEQALEYRTP